MLPSSSQSPSISKTGISCVRDECTDVVGRHSTESSGMDTNAGSSSIPKVHVGHRVSSSRQVKALWIIFSPHADSSYQAEAYAKSRGKSAYRHLLHPRTKGFVSTVQSESQPPSQESGHGPTRVGLKDSHIQYLYDLTFLYAAPGSVDYRAPSLDEQLSCYDLARAGFRYHIHVRRIPLNTLPDGTEDLKVWFERVWGEKDEWLDKMSEGEGEKSGLSSG